MRKIRFYICVGAAALLVTGTLSGCKKRGWSQQDVQTLTEYIQPLKDGGFIADLSEQEWGMFQNCVIEKVKSKYPNYTDFDAQKGKQDSVYNVLIECTAEFLGVDFHNLRRMFPYKELVSAGILDAKMDNRQRDTFYKSLADTINATYMSNYAFVQAIAGDSTAQLAVTGMMLECAKQQGVLPHSEMLNKKDEAPKK